MASPMGKKQQHCFCYQKHCFRNKKTLCLRAGGSHTEESKVKVGDVAEFFSACEAVSSSHVVWQSPNTFYHQASRHHLLVICIGH